jgi:DNA-directed RNA polymerase subunit RPC12/RpoP
MISGGSFECRCAACGRTYLADLSTAARNGRVDFKCAPCGGKFDVTK